MAQAWEVGDRVEWNSSGGKSVGKVVRKLTEPADIDDFHVAASAEEPMYLVESEKSGKRAVHKPEALRKVGG